MTHVCPRCATQLDLAIQGLCPRCLLDVALAAPDPAADDTRFRIVTLLGRGAHGTTYLAEQDEQPRFVSLKILEGAAAEGAPRALHPVRQTLLDARHPSLVQIVSVEIDWPPAVAAVYLQGRKISAGGSVSLDGLVDVARAIAYLHDRGVVHGNIHGANVIVLPRGAEARERWCLLDLASARRLVWPSDAVQDLAAFGTLVRNLAPALTGDPARRDKASAVGLRAVEGRYARASDLAEDLSRS